MPWTDRFRSLLAGAALAIGIVPPAQAASEPRTRLVSCGAESCLLVSGFRADAAAPVRINGRFVAVEGGRHWRIRLPMASLREWSVPYARTITVAVTDVATEAELPIGLLGHVKNLASLTVSVK